MRIKPDVTIGAMISNTLSKCKKCGFCCTQSICPHGVWNLEKTACTFLTTDNLCGLYELIKDDKEVFGWGCPKRSLGR